MRMSLKLDPELAERLAILMDQPLRDPDKTAEGRRAFLEQAQELANSFSQAITAEEHPRHNRWMHLLQTIFSLNYKKERSPMFGALGTILLIVSMVLGGSGVTVVAAQDSMPGQPLYAVKTWSEDARAGMTENTQTRLDLALEYSQRRAEEMQVMLKARQTPPEAVQSRMQAEIDLALQLAAGQPDNEAVRAFEQICQQLRTQDQAFSHLGLPADPQAKALLTRTRDMLHDRLQLCDKGVKDPDQVRQQLRDRSRDPQFQKTGTAPAQKTSDAGSGNPWTTGTPTPGSSYGPGPGDVNGGTNGSVGNNPWTTGTPTPGSGYGPGPSPCYTCDGSGGGGTGSGSRSGSGSGSDSGSGSGSGFGGGSGPGSGSGSGTGTGTGGGGHH